MAKLNKVWRLPAREGWGCTTGYVGVLGAIAFATGCGHYGVDLDGVTEDASASETTTGEDKPTKPNKPIKTEEATASNTSGAGERDASPEDSTGQTKPGKTDDTNLTAGETNTLLSDVSGTHGGGTHGGVPKDAGADASATRDASDDASDNPGETKTDVETGIETGEGEPSAALDGGIPLCDPVCACESGLECNLLCGENECLANCKSSAQCEVVVGAAPVVEIECAAGAYCATSGISGLNVDVTCSGEGECHTECNDNQSCFVQCEGPGRCVSKCHGTGMCDVKCAEGAECYVVYENIDHVALNCGDRAIKLCDGIATCNELCP